MKSYGSFERKIAKALDSFPFIRAGLRKVYQQINYLRFKEKEFTYSLAEGIKMNIPASKEVLEKGNELFFGYYDKSPWNSKMSHYITHEISDYNKVNILVYDFEKDKTFVIGQSNTWNFQQGTMAQWIPDTDLIIYNDVKDHNLVAKIYSIGQPSEQVISYPVQTVNPNKKQYLSINYKRLDKLRPEYGYSVTANNFSGVEPNNLDGIWTVDIDTHQAKLIISIEQLVNNDPRFEMSESKHKVNHAMYSPQGTKFVFMHRWIGPKGKFSRLYVSDLDGKNLKLLLDDRMVSHYYWRDENHVLVWGRTESSGDHYYLINVNTGTIEIIGEGLLDVFGDGHPSYSPDKRWIITDTYPDKARQRHLLLFDTQNSRLITLGRFLAPWKYDAEKRCDLHPRWSPDGSSISIDSSHDGKRKNYILNISSIITGGEKN